MVSTAYLDKVGFAAVRREPGDNSDTAMDALITDYIEAAREDMVAKGLPASMAIDETNPRIRGCIQSFVRWQMQFSNNDATQNLEEYRLQLDELRRNCTDDDAGVTS